MSKTEAIVAALKTMDPEEDGLWTEDGLPKVEHVNSISPKGSKFTRTDIEESWPGFNREVAIDEMDDANPDDDEDDEDIDLDELAGGGGDKGEDPEAEQEPEMERSEVVELIQNLGAAADKAKAKFDKAAGLAKNAALALARARNKYHDSSVPTLAECNAQMQKRMAEEKEGKGVYPIDTSFAPTRGRRKRPDYNPNKDKTQLQ